MWYIRIVDTTQVLNEKLPSSHKIRINNNTRNAEWAPNIITYQRLPCFSMLKCNSQTENHDGKKLYEKIRVKREIFAWRSFCKSFSLPQNILFVAMYPTSTLPYQSTISLHIIVDHIGWLSFAFWLLVNPVSVNPFVILAIYLIFEIKPKKKRKKIKLRSLRYYLLRSVVFFFNNKFFFCWISSCVLFLFIKFSRLKTFFSYILLDIGEYWTYCSFKSLFLVVLLYTFLIVMMIYRRVC